MKKITPFLWFESQAEAAMNYYVSIFPNSKVISSSPVSVQFELEGQEFIGLNAGPQFKFNEAVSFLVDCKDQEEVDYFWNKLTADGGEESRCGWLKDKFGLSWQIVPKALNEYLGSPDREKADRAMQAMLGMNKIVIADLKKAFDGE